MTLGCVYMLYHDNFEEFYVGSSINMRRRRNAHRTDCKNEKSPNYNVPIYQFIREHRGIDEWNFVILKETHDYKIWEQKFIELYCPSLNSRNAMCIDSVIRNRIRTKKIAEKNKERIKNYQQKYRDQHKEKARLYNKEYKQRKKWKKKYTQVINDWIHSQ